MTVDPEVTRRLAEQGDQPEPLFPVTKTCEACGETFAKPSKRTYKEFATRRFCSKKCANRTVPRGGITPGAVCRAGLHEMPDDNVRFDAQGRRKGCKKCAAQKGRERKERILGRPLGKRGGRRKPTPKPAPKPAPVEPVERPVWRPAGFAPQPNTRRAS